MHTLSQLLENAQLNGKIVLIRADLNVPQDDAGNITDDQRIQASIASIQACSNAGATVLVMSHLGRPIEGTFDEKLSLAPIAKHLASLINQPVELIKDYIQTEKSSEINLNNLYNFKNKLKNNTNNENNINNKTIYVLENCRFNIGEKANDVNLAKKLAELCDIYVHDAFGTAHRAEASTHQIANFANLACAGLLLEKEHIALQKALANPQSPTIAIVGGSKVSTKLSLLKNLANKVDQLILGGGIANTFLAALGHDVGASLYEKDLLAQAREVLEIMAEKSKKTGLEGIILPVDVVVFQEFSPNAATRIVDISDVQKNDMIVDFGPQTQALFAKALGLAKTILWNGPVGVFEFESCAAGTAALAKAIADVSSQGLAFSIAGGGDTLAAIAKFKVQDQVSYISTGGGAFLEFLEGQALPAFEVLEKNNATSTVYA